jgi:septum formation protein
MSVILASQSPRRRELLRLLLQEFVCVSPDIDETHLSGESPPDYVARMAVEKARMCRARCADDTHIIAADTTVVIDQRVLGKPATKDEARAMLSLLRGRTHQVLTAVCLESQGETAVRVVETRVSFMPLSAHLIELYLQTGEPWDKAGAYAIQGYAGSFVDRIDGSYSAVVGLPLAETRELLAARGIDPHWT